MKPLKKPLSYDEQMIRLSEEHGLVIGFPNDWHDVLTK